MLIQRLPGQGPDARRGATRFGAGLPVIVVCSGSKPIGYGHRCTKESCYMYFKCPSFYPGIMIHVLEMSWSLRSFACEK